MCASASILGNDLALQSGTISLTSMPPCDCAITTPSLGELVVTITTSNSVCGDIADFIDGIETPIACEEGIYTKTYDLSLNSPTLISKILSLETVDGSYSVHFVLSGKQLILEYRLVYK